MREESMQVTQYVAKDLYKGKTVFVTGGGSGINLGVARNFAALGANIAICGRTQEKLDAAAAELRALGAKVCPVAADVRDIAALDAAFTRSRAELGPMDGTEGMKRLSSAEAKQTIIDAVPLRRMGTVDDIGQAAAFLASPLASYISGCVVVCDGGSNLAGSGRFNAGAEKMLQKMSA